MRIPRRTLISGLCATALSLFVGCKKKQPDGSTVGNLCGDGDRLG